MGIGNYVIQKVHNNAIVVGYHDGEGNIERRLRETKADADSVSTGQVVWWPIIGDGDDKDRLVRAIVIEYNPVRMDNVREAVVLEPPEYRGAIVECPWKVWIEDET